MIENRIALTCIVSVYNSEKTIGDTLISIKNQTIENWECIIVDDNSNDSTISVIKEIIEDDIRFKLIINRENRGKSFGCNLAIKNTISDKIIFIDSDDFFKNNCFESRLNIFEKNSRFGVIFFPNYILFNKNSENIYNEVKEIIFYEIEKKEKTLSTFLKHQLPLRWQHSLAIWKKETLIRIGMYNENLFRIIDADLFTKVLLYDIEYKEIFGDADFYYRITTDENITKLKRDNFIKSSLIYVSSILELVNKELTDKQKTVRLNFKKLIIHLYLITLVSNQFSIIDINIILKFALNNNLISKSLFNIFSKTANKNVLWIFRLKGIRGFIWNLTNRFYIRN